MAYAASKTYPFTFVRCTQPDELLRIPGDPGVTYTKGDLVYHYLANAGTSGVLSTGGDSTATCFAVVEKTCVCAAATQAFPIPGQEIDDDSAYAKTLVTVRPLAPAGMPIFKATFAAHGDDTVATWTASTRTATFATGFAANDYPNGAFAYCYEGPGAGEVNVVEDYVHGSLSLIFHRPTQATLTTASKFVVVAGEAATYKGVGPAFGQIDAQDKDNLHAADGADDGDYVVWMDWGEAASYLADLSLPVVKAINIF